MFLRRHGRRPDCQSTPEELEDESPPKSRPDKRRDSCFAIITALMILFGLIPFLLLLLLTLLRWIL